MAKEEQRTSRGRAWFSRPESARARCSRSGGLVQSSTFRPFFPAAAQVAVAETEPALTASSAEPAAAAADASAPSASAAAPPPAGDKPAAGGDEEEEDDDEEKETCGFCLYMMGGGCKKPFKAWSKCVDRERELSDDYALHCQEEVRSSDRGGLGGRRVGWVEMGRGRALASRDWCILEDSERGDRGQASVGRGQGSSLGRFGVWEERMGDPILWRRGRRGRRGGRLREVGRLWVPFRCEPAGAFCGCLGGVPCVASLGLCDAMPRMRAPTRRSFSLGCRPWLCASAC